MGEIGVFFCCGSYLRAATISGKYGKCFELSPTNLIMHSFHLVILCTLKVKHVKTILKYQRRKLSIFVQKKAQFLMVFEFTVVI